MHLLKQLKSYIEEMRLLKPPNLGVVEGIEGGKLYDMRLQDGLKGFGPFDSVRDFHSFLRGGISASPEQIPEVNEMVKKHEKAHFSTCFTHGDLDSMNVLVQGDNIVGIIDWDTAGWFPEYWEYTTAYNVHPYNGFWKDEIGNSSKNIQKQLKWSGSGRNTLEHFDRQIYGSSLLCLLLYYF